MISRELGVVGIQLGSNSNGKKHSKNFRRHNSNDPVNTATNENKAGTRTRSASMDKRRDKCEPIYDT